MENLLKSFLALSSHLRQLDIASHDERHMKPVTFEQDDIWEGIVAFVGQATGSKLNHAVRESDMEKTILEAIEDRKRLKFSKTKTSQLEKVRRASLALKFVLILRADRRFQIQRVGLAKCAHVGSGNVAFRKQSPENGSSRRNSRRAGNLFAPSRNFQHRGGEQNGKPRIDSTF